MSSMTLPVCVSHLVDTSISGLRKAQLVDQLAKTWVLAEVLNSDNGPESTSKSLLSLSQCTDVKLQLIQPGNRTHNAFVETLTECFRDGCLNPHRLKDIDDAGCSIADW